MGTHNFHDSEFERKDRTRQKMKIFTSFLAAAYAKSVMHQSDVKRALTGQWISDMTGSPRHRRADIDGEAGFRPLAAMMLYLQDFGASESDPQSASSFENEIDELRLLLLDSGHRRRRHRWRKDQGHGRPSLQ